MSKMEKNQGDLNDILRASGGSMGHDHDASTDSNWQHQFPCNFSAMENNFGDPFSTMRDPLGSPDHHTDNPSCSLFKEDCNIFSRIQISPTKFPVAGPRGINGKTPAVLPSDMINANPLQLQISSPRNPAIKRRKSHAKKVVCIPAPAAANSRSSGEVVPSDLWAWRKYGQKPIKGSPYPRGYYRCSSSKGCSARKQVERSRTDPNMLVITYTSEHNHPWPTQRNALAGSTRSHPSKTHNTVSPKQETNKENISRNDDGLSSTKEEIDQQELDIFIDDGELRPQTYKPALPSEDFFAHLDHMETDPMNLQFPQAFAEDADADHDHDQEHEQKETKATMAMDPFSLFDWSSGGDNNVSF